MEIYEGVTPANIKARYEPRKYWPINSACAAPYAESKPEQGKRLKMTISFADKYKRLPIVELREVA